MKRILYFILFPVILAVSGEFILKVAVRDLTIGLNIQSLLIIFQQPLIFLGILFIILSAALWIVGMSKFQLSFMYPFLSINYVVIVVGSELFLGETVQLNRYIAILLIIIGLIFISRSPHSQILETKETDS